jgi:manganese/iron transport system permease protein
VISLGSVWLGLTLSYYLSTAGSATMALVPIVIFFIVLVIRSVARGVRRPSREVSHA